MIKSVSFLLFLSSLSESSAFSVPQQLASRTIATSLEANADENNDLTTRRDVFWKAASVVSSAAFVSSPFTLVANAEEVATVVEAAPSKISKVVVAGATGQTGSRTYDKLRTGGDFTTFGGVRNVGKAEKSLSLENAELKRLDVVEDSLETLTATLKETNADGLIIATGFNPGKNLLRMNAACHEVDNVGTIKLIDAAKNAGIKKVVMVSSILTNGRAWGQEESPGFKITNAFGNALDEKLVAELYLRKSGLDYTIVRPGGLQAKPPTGALLISGEDTLNSGEISRDLVADVCIASLNDKKASNKVLEIIEDDGTPPKVFNGLNM